MWRCAGVLLKFGEKYALSIRISQNLVQQIYVRQIFQFNRDFSAELVVKQIKKSQITQIAQFTWD
jgi:hypothetical protein